MSLATPTPAPATEFDEFLYAPIGEERNGMLLSVLSALARLNVDPWDEAARLSRLPRDAATKFMGTLLSGLPNMATARTAAPALAEHLVELLPRRLPPSRGTSPAAERLSAPVSTPVSHRQAVAKSLLVYLVFMAFLLLTQWLVGRATRDGVSPATAASTSLESAAHKTPLRLASPATSPP